MHQALSGLVTSTKLRKNHLNQEMTYKVNYVKIGPKPLKKNCGDFTAENRKSCG